MPGGKKPKDRGARWAKATRDYLQGVGLQVMARSVGEAGHDLQVTPCETLFIECKDIDRSAWGAAVTQADAQAGAGGVGVVWAKNRGKSDPGQGYLVLRAHHLPALINAFTLVEARRRLGGEPVFLETSRSGQPPSLSATHSGADVDGPSTAQLVGGLDDKARAEFEEWRASRQARHPSEKLRPGSVGDDVSEGDQ